MEKKWISKINTILMITGIVVLGIYLYIILPSDTKVIILPFSLFNRYNRHSSQNKIVSNSLGKTIAPLIKYKVRFVKISIIVS
jgi:hypothetical protein